jgi:phospholipase C
LPGTADFAPPDRLRHPDYVPTPPIDQAVPTQEPGLRHARALPYEFNVSGRADFSQGAFEIDFTNTGKAGACFQVRSGDPSIGPWTYTVEAGKLLSDTWDLVAGGRTTYDLSVYGPNGFFRAFKGSLTGDAATKVEVSSIYDPSGRELTLVVVNHGTVPRRVSITDVYSGRSLIRLVAAGAKFSDERSLRSTFGWYDLLVEVASDNGFARRLAGHVETGEDSSSDPAIGSGQAS